MTRDDKVLFACWSFFAGVLGGLIGGLIGSVVACRLLLEAAVNTELIERLMGK